MAPSRIASASMRSWKRGVSGTRTVRPSPSASTREGTSFQRRIQYRVIADPRRRWGASWRPFYPKPPRHLDKAQPHPYARPGRTVNDRREDGGPGASNLYPPADLPGGDPDAQARRAHTRARAPARPGLQEAQHVVPGHRHVTPLWLDDRAHARGPYL